MNIQESIAERFELAESTFTVYCAQEGIANYTDFFNSRLFERHTSLKDIDKEVLKRLSRKVIEPALQEQGRTTQNAIAFYGGMCVGLALAYTALEESERGLFATYVDDSITSLLKAQDICSINLEEQIERYNRGVGLFENEDRAWLRPRAGGLVCPRRQLGYDYICRHAVAAMTEHAYMRDHGELPVYDRECMKIEAATLARVGEPLFVEQIVAGS